MRLGFLLMLLVVAGIAGLVGRDLYRYAEGEFEQSERDYRGWKKRVEIPAELPDVPPVIPRLRHDAQAVTSAVDAVRAMGGNIGDIDLPMSRPVQFDRKTESRSLVFYWRSEEDSDAGSERTVALLEDAALSLKDYLDPLDKESKPSIYFKKLASCDSSPDEKTAPGVAGRHAITIETCEAFLVSVAVHELAHFYSPPGICHGDSSQALCEGIATFAASDLSGRLRELHWSASRSPVRDKVAEVFVMGWEQFFSDEHADWHYTISGSLVAFVAQRYGIRAAFVLDSPIRSARGPSRDELAAQWLDYLQDFTRARRIAASAPAR